MPRYLTTSQKDFLAGEVLTLATCWKIKRTDDTEYFFTDHDRQLVFNGDAYTPLNSGDAGPVAASDKINVDNMEVEIILNSDGIDEDELRNGFFDMAQIWVFWVNYEDLSMPEFKLFFGLLGEVEIIDDMAHVEVRSVAQLCQQEIGETISPDCLADLGDDRCKVDLTSYTHSGTVTAVTSDTIFTDSGLTQIGGYFDYGKVTWLTGDNAGLSMDVAAFAYGGEVTLFEAMPANIQIGDTFTIVAGCDRKFATCKDRFSNVVNHRGFPHVPGTDKALQYPGVK